MKKLICLCLTLLMLFSFCSCSKKSKVEAKQQELIKQYNYILEENALAEMVYVYDVDNNGTPELIFQYGQSEAEIQYLFYTYTDKIICLGMVPASHMSPSYSKDDNSLWLVYGNQGYVIATVCSIVDNKVVCDEKERYFFNNEGKYIADDGTEIKHPLSENLIELEGTEKTRYSYMSTIITYGYEEGINKYKELVESVNEKTKKD